MAESQSSSSSCSDRESLMSSEKSIKVVACKCDHKAIDIDLASANEEIGCQTIMDSDEHGTIRPFKDEHTTNIELKQPKTIKNIMMALKEGKVRENSSPMRGNRIKAAGVCNQRTNAEAPSKIPRLVVITPAPKGIADTPPSVPAKISPDSTKRIQGLHASKHQVLIFSFSLL